MARFYPPIPDDFNGSYAEERVYHLLKGFPDKVRVFHSFKWMASEHYRYTREGEADFVVYDPDFGILCIEVKGGRISYRSGQWFQGDFSGERLLDKSPWSQARNASHFIRRLIQRLSPNVRIPIYPCVWFPDVEISNDQRFPVEIPKYAILSKKESTDSKVAYDSLKKIWGSYQKDQGFGIQIEIGFSDKLPEILLPSFNLIARVSQAADENDRHYFRFTKEQFKILEFIEDEPRVGIAGGAGSGKTLIASELAKSLSKNGDKTLLLVYNSALRIELKKYLEQTDVSVHNWHSLAMEHIGKEDPSKVSDLFMEQILADPKSFKYQHVVIDEAQDFEENWLATLDLLVSEGSMAVFFDPLQSIQRHSQELPEWLKNIGIKLSLNRNCRNSESIAKTAHAFLNQKQPRMLHSIKGEMPIWIESTDSPDTSLKETLTIIQSFLNEDIQPEEIVVLTMFPLERSFLKTTPSLQHKNKSISFSEKKEKGKILKSTIRKFKGLEAQVVIIVDFVFSKDRQDQMEFEQKLKLLYTAASRARSYLYLVSKPLPNEVYWDSETPEPAETFRKVFKERYGFA